MEYQGYQIPNHKKQPLVSERNKSMICDANLQIRLDQRPDTVLSLDPVLSIRFRAVLKCGFWELRNYNYWDWDSWNSQGPNFLLYICICWNFNNCNLLSSIVGFIGAYCRPEPIIIFPSSRAKLVFSEWIFAGFTTADNRGIRTMCESFFRRFYWAPRVPVASDWLEIGHSR